MKKLIALTLSTALLVSSIVLMSVVPVSAAASLDIGTIAPPVLANGVYTFTVPFTATEVDQVTLLATRGAATAPTTIDDTTIVAIDQVPSTANSFTFAVDATKFVAVTTPNIYIKLGGTSINTAISKDPILMVETTTTFKVIGNVSPTSTIGDATEDAKVEVTVNLRDETSAIVDTTVANATTGAYEFNNVATGPYSVDFVRRGGLKKLPLPVDTTVAVDGTVNLGNTTIYNGDVNCDGYIDIGDAYLIIPMLETYPGDGIYDPLYDMNLDGYVDIGDAYLVIPQLEFYDDMD